MNPDTMADILRNSKRKLYSAVMEGLEEMIESDGVSWKC